MAREELHQPVAPAEEILLHVLPTPEEISHRLGGLVRDADAGQFAGAEEPDELHGIAAVGLDPVSGLARRQGRRDHLAGHAAGRELALQRVARGPAS